MRKLLINNTLALIDNNQAILFSHKVNNLDDFSIINLAVSKTIQLPRCQQNDEIFGYIGEITRLTFNYNNNEKTSISFNQTKKIAYVYLDDSEILSEGNLVVENITEDYYEVSLYDKMIDILEQFDGNDETGSGYLNDLDLYYEGSNSKIEYSLFSARLPYYAQNFKNLKYSININDDNLTDNLFRCIDSSTNKPTTFELPEDMSQVQARTIKAYDVDYNVPINGVIESINKKYNDIIEVDDKLDNYFNDLHLNCGKVRKYSKAHQEYELKPYSDLTHISTTNAAVKKYAFLTYPAGHTVNGIINTVNTNYNRFFIPLKNIDGNFISKKNGKYYIEIPLNISLFTSSYYTGSSNVISVFNNKNYNYNNILEGEKFGQLYFKTRMCNYTPGTVPAYGTPQNFGNKEEYNTSQIENEINFIKGVSSNVTFNSATNKYTISCNNTLVLEYDYLPEIGTLTNMAIELDIEFPQKSHSLFFSEKVGTSTTHIGYDVKISVASGGKVNYTPGDSFHTGELVTGKNIFPKVSIKDFLIELAKYHNLKLVILNGKLRIEKKLYTSKNEFLNVINIEGVNPKLFDFNNIILSYGLTSNDLINSSYEDLNRKKYGQKLVNLNYSIRNKTKKIEYSSYIPALIKDTKKYAYDEFGGYFNSGRNKSNLGVTQGLSDKIVFCFLNNIVDNVIYLCDDTFYEANMASNYESSIPTEVKFLKTNLDVVYTSGLFSFTGTSYGETQSIPISNYYTSSPYKFNGDVISKSLEMNKPIYNYTNITDTQYPDSATHYERYFKKYISEIYNVNNHILECDVILNSKLDVSQVYHYNNVNYIITEIPEYDPFDNYVKGIKLLKVNDKNNYLFPYTKEEGNITINYYSNITQTSLTVNERINYTGGDTIVTGGVKYGLNSNSLNLSSTISNPGITFSVNITSGLIKNTKFYFQPYMVSATGIYTYGEVSEAITLDDYSIPTVNITSINTTTYTTFNAVGNILSQGGYPITEYGFVFSSSSQFPTTADTKIITGTTNGFGTYGDTISNLNSNTTYYVRAYAINQNGTAYSSNQLIARTNTYSIPMLDTSVPFNIRQTDGDSGGYRIEDGGSPVTQKGIVIQLAGSGIPSITNNIFMSSNGSGTSDFTAHFNGLISDESYTISSFATNAYGTGYGQQDFFNTLPIGLPIVYTVSYFGNLTFESVDLYGVLNYNGGDPDPITEYGVIISKSNSNPTEGGVDCTTIWSGGSSITNGNDFLITVNGLTENTSYYYRAYVSNIIGIGYGQVYSFNTLYEEPYLGEYSLKRNADFNAIAQLRFNIYSNYEVMEYGVLYSAEITNPTFGNSLVREWSGDPAGVVAAEFEDVNLEDSMIGEIYCKAYILTSLGYTYSPVFVDTYY